MQEFRPSQCDRRWCFSRRRYRGISSFPSYEENGWHVPHIIIMRYLFEASVAHTGSEKFAPGLRFEHSPHLHWVGLVQKRASGKTNCHGSTTSRPVFMGMVGSDAGIAVALHLRVFEQQRDRRIRLPDDMVSQYSGRNHSCNRCHRRQPSGQPRFRDGFPPESCNPEC